MIRWNVLHPSFEFLNRAWKLNRAEEIIIILILWSKERERRRRIFVFFFPSDIIWLVWRSTISSFSSPLFVVAYLSLHSIRLNPRSMCFLLLQSVNFTSVLHNILRFAQVHRLVKMSVLTRGIHELEGFNCTGVEVQTVDKKLASSFVISRSLVSKYAQ